MLGQTNETILKSALQRNLRHRATPAENALWYHLRAKRLAGHKFRRQHPFGDFILDLVCIEKRLVIEVDGGQHCGSDSDVERDASLRNAGFNVLRVWNHDVLNRMDRVLELVLAALNETTHHPLPGPPLEGEGEVRCPEAGEHPPSGP